MILKEIFYILVVLTLICISTLIVIVAENFFNKFDKKCDYCQGKINTCRIIVTDELGTKVYCSPYCVEPGFKGESVSLDQV